jgi:DNA polymerase III subunit delta'
MSSTNIVGQKETLANLINLVQSNRLSHAILFLGNEGSGALPLAITMAQYIVSRGSQPPPTANLFGLPEPQGHDNELFIHSKAAELIHPDLHFSFPVVTKKDGQKPVSNDYIKEFREFYKQQPYANVFDWLQFINAENKQGNITAEECNDIMRKLSLKSFEAEYKILVMWMPEYLGKEGNKLLKIIEEPPPNTLFFLVAEAESQILPTIISRCQLVRIPPIADEDIEEALKFKNGCEPTQARQIALIAEGNYREAQHLLQHNDTDWQSLLRQWLNAALKQGPQEQQKFITDAAELGREKQKQFLKYFLQILEISLRLRLLGEQHMKISPSELDFARRLNSICGVNMQNALITELEKCIYYIERNANPKMLFHALTLKLKGIIMQKAIFLAS